MPKTFYKKRKTQKTQKTRKITKKRVRGGCGCNKPLFGGSAGLQELPHQYYYPQNMFMNDPSNLPNIHSSRFMNGGKQTKKRKYRKQKGGSFLSSFSIINPLTPINSSNSDLVYQQPVINKFGPHNNYLV